MLQDWRFWRPGRWAASCQPSCHNQGRVNLFLTFSGCLLSQGISRTAHFCRDILHFGQPVPDMQHSLLTVDMYSWLKRELGENGCIDIRHPPLWVFGEDVPPTVFAPFTRTLWGFIVRSNVVSPLSDLYGFWTPQGESIDGASRPVSAGFAMTIPHTRAGSPETVNLTAPQKQDPLYDSLLLIMYLLDD